MLLVGVFLSCSLVGSPAAVMTCAAAAPKSGSPGSIHAWSAGLSSIADGPVGLLSGGISDLGAPEAGAGLGGRVSALGRECGAADAVTVAELSVLRCVVGWSCPSNGANGDV